MPARSTLSRRRAPAALVLGALALLTAAPTRAANYTYVIPHWIETSGYTSQAPYEFNDYIYLRYTAGTAGTPSGPGAIIDLYLYDNSSGQPLTIFGTQVCNPCTGNIGGNAPGNLPVEIGDQIAYKTGFATDTYVGYAVVVVRGSDPGGVTLENDLVNSHSKPTDLAVTSYVPIRRRAEDPVFPGARVFSIPHMVEAVGTTTAMQYTFDETLFATYVGGQAGVSGGGGASLQLYLYDEDTGGPLVNKGLAVCAPCAFGVGGQFPRSLAIRMEDLINAAGGSFDVAVKRAAGVVVVGGSDPGNVVLQPWLVNSHTNAYDLASTVQSAQPMTGAALVSVLVDDHPGQALALSAAPNPAASHVDLGFSMATAGEVELSIFDLGGRKVADVYRGRAEAGPHSLKWDGQDMAGNPVSGGVYFARLSGKDKSEFSRVVMLK